MEFLELESEQLKELPNNLALWLKGKMIEEGMKFDGDSFEEIFTEFSEDYFSVYYFEKGINTSSFEFDTEGGIILVNGNLVADNINLYGITDMYVGGNVECSQLVVADSSITIGGSLTCSVGLVITDTACGLTVGKDLITPKIVNVVPDEDCGECIIFNNIPTIPELYISENSYGQLGSKDILKSYGIVYTGTYTEDEMQQYY